MQDAVAPSAGAGVGSHPHTPTIEGVTATPGRSYFLVAPSVSSRSIYPVKRHNHFLTSGDKKGCLFSTNRALAISCSITFADLSYLRKLTDAAVPNPIAEVLRDTAVSIVRAPDAVSTLEGERSNPSPALLIASDLRRVRASTSPLAGAGVASARATLKSETLSRS